MSSSTRWLAAVAAVIVVVIVASAAVAIGMDREEEFPEGSPEAAVQRYLRAVSDGDLAVAREMFAADLEARCEEFDGLSQQIVRQDARDFSATFRETVEQDGTTLVHVELTHRYGDPPFPPLGGSESTRPEVFELQQEDGEWRFEKAPWPLFCPRSAQSTPGPVASATPGVTATPAVTRASNAR